MERSVRGASWAVCAVIGVITLAAAGSAWGCVPQARLVTLAPGSSGPAGSQVTVEGLAFDPGPVEVRWGASDGLKLGAATGPSFSVPVTIPDAPEGLHVIVVLSRNTDGSIGNAGTAAFQVTPADGARPGTAPAAQRDDAGSFVDDGDGAGVVALAVTGGGGLVLLGGLGGAALSRRRRPPPT